MKKKMKMPKVVWSIVIHALDVCESDYHETARLTGIKSRKKDFRDIKKAKEWIHSNCYEK